MRKLAAAIALTTATIGLTTTSAHAAHSTATGGSAAVQCEMALRRANLANHRVPFRSLGFADIGGVTAEEV